ncbi:hypothetical protein Tco_1226797 [Tanacetum coccineum]
MLHDSQFHRRRFTRLCIRDQASRFTCRKYLPSHEDISSDLKLSSHSSYSFKSIIVNLALRLRLSVVGFFLPWLGHEAWRIIKNDHGFWTSSPKFRYLKILHLEKGKPQQDDIGFVDSGCSRHMTGNIAYLSDFKEFDGGYVTFEGGAHGGIISAKGLVLHVKRGRDTKIPQSSGPPVKVGDEAVHKELGDRMERAATTASSLEAEQDSGSGPRCQDTILGDVDAQTRFETTSKQSNDPPLSRGYTLGSGEDIMSSASSVVTYTSVYTDSEPGRVFWGADEEIPDGGVPRVIVYGYDGLPMQPVDPPSPDYVPGPEHPSSPDYVPGPEHPPSPIEIPYVPEPEYPEYLVPSEDEAPMEDQPLPADASPVALSPGYVPDSDPEEDPEEDSEEEHADYPADGGDGDDEPSGDDTDDDDADDDDEEPFEDEEDDEEEEEHLAPADSPVIPVVDPVPSAGDTEAFETDETAPTPRPPQIRIPFAQTRLRRARKTVRPEPPMSASMEARIAEHAAAPTPPLPVASSPLPLPSPLTTSPTDAGAPLGYRAAGIRMRAAVASPPSLLPSTSPRTDIPEAEMPPRKRVCLTTPAPGYEIGESSAAGAARQPRPTPEVDT